MNINSRQTINKLLESQNIKTDDLTKSFTPANAHGITRVRQFFKNIIERITYLWRPDEWRTPEDLVKKLNRKVKDLTKQISSEQKVHGSHFEELKKIKSLSNNLLDIKFVTQEQTISLQQNLNKAIALAQKSNKELIESDDELAEKNPIQIHLKQSKSQLVSNLQELTNKLKIHLNQDQCDKLNQLMHFNTQATDLELTKLEHTVKQSKKIFNYITDIISSKTEDPGAMNKEDHDEQLSENFNVDLFEDFEERHSAFKNDVTLVSAYDQAAKKHNELLLLFINVMDAPPRPQNQICDPTDLDEETGNSVPTDRSFSSSSISPARQDPSRKAMEKLTESLSEKVIHPRLPNTRPQTDRDADNIVQWKHIADQAAAKMRGAPTPSDTAQPLPSSQEATSQPEGASSQQSVSSQVAPPHPEPVEKIDNNTEVAQIIQELKADIKKRNRRKYKPAIEKIEKMLTSSRTVEQKKQLFDLLAQMILTRSKLTLNKTFPGFKIYQQYINDNPNSQLPNINLLDFNLDEAIRSKLTQELNQNQKDDLCLFSNSLLTKINSKLDIESGRKYQHKSIYHYKLAQQAMRILIDYKKTLSFEAKQREGPNKLESMESLKDKFNIPENPSDINFRRELINILKKLAGNVQHQTDPVLPPAMTTLTGFPSATETSIETKNLQKTQHVLNELISTEKTFHNHITDILTLLQDDNNKQQFIKHLESLNHDPELSENDLEYYTSIYRSILDSSALFYNLLRNVNTLDDLKGTEESFVKLTQNIIPAVVLLKSLQTMMQQHTSADSLLITPAQRTPRYRLLFTEMATKYATDKANESCKKIFDEHAEYTKDYKDQYLQNFIKTNPALVKHPVLDRLAALSKSQGTQLNDLLAQLGQ